MKLPRMARLNRRHPAAAAAIVVGGLLATGGAYATVSTTTAAATTEVAAGDAEAGSELFQANCASCHGPQAGGRQDIAPSLVGVGAAAVDFQVGTGRMPMAKEEQQAPRKQVVFNDQEINDLAAYVANLGPGPSIPDEEYLRTLDDAEAVAEGGEIFRINCAMCHNVVGAGGALTRGKYAPKLQGVESRHIYEAMSTGPQMMPVFSDANIAPEDKQKVISYLKTLEDRPAAGGITLGSLGTVTEGLFAWLGAMVILIGFAVWLGAKAV